MSLKPGRELDALIAEKVMGWKRIPANSHGLDWIWDKKEGCLWHEVQLTPRYSMGITAAWEVVEKVCSNDDWNFTLDYEAGSATFLEHQEQDDGPQWYGDIEYTAWGDSMPHAICLAALRVVGAIE